MEDYEKTDLAKALSDEADFVESQLNFVGSQARTVRIMRKAVKVLQDLEPDDIEYGLREIEKRPEQADSYALGRARSTLNQGPR